MWPKSKSLYNSMEISFNQTALAEWIKLVDEEKTLQSTEGVSNEDKKIMKVRVVMEMVNLLPGLSDQEKADLILSLIQKENIQEVTVEDPGTSESESN
jgi:uncharacterized protein with PIN domain